MLHRGIYSSFYERRRGVLNLSLYLEKNWYTPFKWISYTLPCNWYAFSLFGSVFALFFSSDYSTDYSGNGRYCIIKHVAVFQWRALFIFLFIELENSGYLWAMLVIFSLFFFQFLSLFADIMSCHQLFAWVEVQTSLCQQLRLGCSVFVLSVT